MTTTFLLTFATSSTKTLCAIGKLIFFLSYPSLSYISVNPINSNATSVSFAILTASSIYF